MCLLKIIAWWFYAYTIIVACFLPTAVEATLLEGNILNNWIVPGLIHTTIVMITIITFETILGTISGLTEDVIQAASFALTMSKMFFNNNETTTLEFGKMVSILNVLLKKGENRFVTSKPPVCKSGGGGC